MHYFSKFPNVVYYPRVYGSNPTVATDISKRFRIRDLASSAPVIYYQYSIRSGDRPDIIADKYYKDSTLDWLVLLANEIQDPYFEWYLSPEQLAAHIRKKYNSISVASSTIHHYEWIRQVADTTVDSYGETVIIPERTLTVDYATYITLSSSRRRQLSAYDYEVNLNEKRRNIVLIDINYAPAIISAYKNIFNTR